MAESILAPPLPFGARRRASEGLLRPIARRFARHRLAVVGLVIIVTLFLAATLASLIAPYDPEPSARLAVLFAVAGRYRDAAVYFERAYRISPSVELAANAARAWSLAGDRERARFWEAKG